MWVDKQGEDNPVTTDNKGTRTEIYSDKIKPIGSKKDSNPISAE